MINLRYGSNNSTTLETRKPRNSSTADVTIENENTSLATNESSMMKPNAYAKHCKHEHKAALPKFSESSPAQNREKGKKKVPKQKRIEHSQPKKPLWRDSEKLDQVSKQTLERFAFQLQNKATIRHIENEDPYNTLDDKTVQHHKQSRKYTKFLEDRHMNPDDPHEMRFCSLPYDGLPLLNSKVKRPPQLVNMHHSDGRKQPILHLTSNENVQFKKPYNDHIYDYDLKSTNETITRDIKFIDKSICRFDSKGIFGDLFDKKKN